MHSVSESNQKKRVMSTFRILAGLAFHATIFVLGIVYLVKVIKKNDNDKWFNL